MCVVSMIGDYYRDALPKRYPWVKDYWPTQPAPMPNDTTTVNVIGVSQKDFDALKKEVEEIKALLQKAKEYDARTGQPGCEIDDKVAFLRKIGELVGGDLDEVFGAPK